MAVRLQAQMESALQVAHWLRQQPEVAQVLHPGLPGAPGHDLWRRDFTGACSLFGIEFQRQFTTAATHRFVEALDLFGIGSSWGGYESLAVPTTGFVTRTAGGKPFAGPVVRIHIGLEDVDDLIADLAHGLAALRAPAD
jgi:cystathionine beta-lyase